MARRVPQSAGHQDHGLIGASLGPLAQSWRARGPGATFPVLPTSNDLCAELCRVLGPERALCRPLERVAYASDASVYRLIPRAVVQPKSASEVRSLFSLSHARRVPLTFRAGGTSLSGQAVTDGILVDISKHWTRVAAEQSGVRVRVEPGVTGGRVNRLLAPHGRKIGPDPASIDSAMLGGIVANNSSGMCSGVRDNAYHTLASLRAVLPDGTLLDTGDAACDAVLAESAPELVRGLVELRRRVAESAALAEKVRRKYRMKNTMGYSLNAFLDFERPSRILEHLLIGSEGTLGFIAEVTLHTLPDDPFKLTGLLVFADVESASRAVAPFAESKARAVEIMDHACLAVARRELGGLETPEGAAALLVEYQAHSHAALEGALAAAERVARNLPALALPKFTREPAERAQLWKIRKGLYPSVGALRARGTGVIIEDVAVPLPRMARAIGDLQGAFKEHGYDEAVLFGHAKDGNLHFVITQSFHSEAEVARYAAFMQDVTRIVVDAHDGALKAEHGAGRNMAPFLEREWGREACAVMRDLKDLIDPSGLLNPGVILNTDPRAHLRHLKALPQIEPEVDRCIECGFCESVCPSRRLTLTPRQRIVVRRELARLGDSYADAELRTELERDYAYAGLETCAADGMCETACPVHINTGDLVKRLRGQKHSRQAVAQAELLARHLVVAERLLRGALRAGHAAERVLGARILEAAARGSQTLTGSVLPKWNPAVPEVPPLRLPPTERANAEVVYFPSCLSRVLGRPDASAATLVETVLAVTGRAGVRVWLPPDARGHCCGMPFGSKGYAAAGRVALQQTVADFWQWSEQGRLPVAVDASSCVHTLRSAEPELAGEALERWRALTILDSIELARDFVLPRLALLPLPIRVSVHPNCAARKLGLAGALLDLVRRAATEASVPEELDCCATAGDRGLLFPELVRSATEREAAETAGFDAYVSSNLTCEMGMSAATGRPYRSFWDLLERATRASLES